MLVQFVEAAADRVGVGGDLLRRQRQQIGDRDGDDDAVDRLARPVAAQEIEKGEPASAVGLGVGILRRVAPGGVDQQSLVGEPPVAIARAADARHRLRAAADGERKAQARIDERRGLARARRADDEIPRQIVERRPARLAAAQGLERVLHLLLEDGGVAVLLDRLRHRLFERGGGAHALVRRARR